MKHELIGHKTGFYIVQFAGIRHCVEIVQGSYGCKIWGKDGPPYFDGVLETACEHYPTIMYGVMQQGAVITLMQG